MSKSRIESRIIGAEVMFRMTCRECGRVGIYHRDLAVAQNTAALHERHAHQAEVAA